MVPLQYLSNFWRNLEMSLINYEINLHPRWSENCFIVTTNVAVQATTFSITDAKHVQKMLYKIMKNCLNNENLVLKEQLTGININQKYQQKDQIIIHIS